MVRIFFPAFVVVVALATFAIGYAFLESKNHISFPDRDIEVQCPLSTPRFGRPGHSFDFAGQNLTVMETGCADEVFVQSDIYGYDKVTGNLLYISRLGNSHISNITYYAKPSEGLDPALGVVKRCGGRTVNRNNNALSTTYDFPCTDEVGVVPVPENGTVNLTGFLADADHYRYQVSCGPECDRTVEMVERGSWRIVSP